MGLPQTTHPFANLGHRGLRTIDQAEALHACFHQAARAIQACGRVVVIGRPSEDCADARQAAVQRGLEGFVRALAKELKRGITAQTVLVAQGAEAQLEGTLRFLLSARSAYVSAQVIRLAASAQTRNTDWAQPLGGRRIMVTGAARGIGAAIAQTLARDGAQVWCVDVPQAQKALQAVAGAMNKQIGTKVFWVQTGGFDTHAAQGVQQGAYFNLMATLNDGIKAFYDDLNAQGLLNNTAVLVYSEFGRRISENGSSGTDHGAGANMMLMGGAVRGGLYGTAPNLNMDPQNPTLENANGDVKWETDFRSVYAKVLDNWLGTNSVSVLGGDYRAGAPNVL